MPALQPGTAHPCPDPLDDEVAFQFCDGSDDDDNGPPERAAGIEIFAEADELDFQVVEFVQHFEEVPNGPGDPVRGPHQDYLEATTASIPKQVIEARPAGFRPREPVSVLGNDLKTPLLGHRAKIVELGFRVLIHSRYAQIKSYSFQVFLPIEAITSCK